MTRAPHSTALLRHLVLRRLLEYFILLLLIVAVPVFCAVSPSSPRGSSGSSSSDDATSTSSSTSQKLNGTHLCPGITATGCSDDGCYGHDASSCPSTCVYNAAVQQCVGQRSCLLHACSGHGMCQVNDRDSGSRSSSVSSREVLPTCQCDAGYYGDDCGTRCDQAYCAEVYGVLGLSCTSDGACRCPGHMDNLAEGCSFCVDGWYGVLCTTPCPCNGHGLCDRSNGECECFIDDVRGHWGGPTCSMCMKTYMGDNCTARNAFLTPLPYAVMHATFNVENGSSSSSSSSRSRGRSSDRDSDEGSDSPAALSVGGGSDSATLQWVGERYLVLSRGAAVLCATINVSTRIPDDSFTDSDWFSLDPAEVADLVMGTEPPYVASFAALRSVLLRNNTVALLTVGSLPSASAETADGGAGAAHGCIGVSIVHATVDTTTGTCTYATVSEREVAWTSSTSSASTDLDGAAERVVDAHFTEDGGWALLLSSGVMMLQHRAETPLQLPAGVTPKAIHVDGVSGLVLVLGVKQIEEEWALYVTQSTSSSNSDSDNEDAGGEGMGLVEVSVVNATTGDVFTQTGTAWRVNVSGSNIYLIGTSRRAPHSSSSSPLSFSSSSAPGSESSESTSEAADAPLRAWALVGQLSSPLTTPSGLTVYVTGYQSTSLSVVAGEDVGEPRAAWLYSKYDIDDNVSTVISVVQTSTTAKIFSWVMSAEAAEFQTNATFFNPSGWSDGTIDASSSSFSSSSGDSNDDSTQEFVLRGRQDLNSQINPSLLLHATYIEATALLMLYQSTADDVVTIYPFTGYAVVSATPRIIDASGSTKVVVRGILLRSEMSCAFTALDKTDLSPVLFSNATVVVCVPQAWVAGSVCMPLMTNVQMPNSVFPTRSSNDYTVFRYHTPTIFNVYGTDSGADYTSTFARLPIQVIGQGFVDTPTLLCRFVNGNAIAHSRGHYLSSRQMQCDFPDGPVIPQSSTAAGMVAVSLDGTVFTLPVFFAFVGAAAQLLVRNVDTTFTVRSAAFVALPTVELGVADESGRFLQELDTVSVGGAAVERLVEVSAPWFNSTRKEVPGPLDPATSLVVLAYINTTVKGETSFSIFLQYPLVGVGQLTFSTPGLAPTSITYTVEAGDPYALEVAVQPSPQLSSHYNDTSRQPMVVVRDIAGNVLNDVGYRSWRDNVSFIGVSYFDGATWAVDQTSLLVSDSYYNFSRIKPRAFFGHSYRMTFFGDGFANVTSDVMVTSDCYQDEYGVYGTMQCLPCPAHATCNGSYVFNVTDGYWKGGELAYDLYACPRPRVCRGGKCASGYTGVLCGVCASGYGQTGSQCVACFTAAVNITLIVLLALFVLLVPLFLILLTFQVFGPHLGLVHGARAILDLLQLTGLVLLPLPQLPDYVGRFIVFTQLVATGNVLELSPINCLFSQLDAQGKLVIELVAVWIILITLFIVLLYGDVLFARHYAALRKKRWFLSLLYPFPSEEAYLNRLAELGLDEERALGGAVTAEAIDPKQKTIREAYALVDNNRYAISAVSQLPNSAVRESALESLLAEQAELQNFLRQYEAHVSRGGFNNNNGSGSGGNNNNDGGKGGAMVVVDAAGHVSNASAPIFATAAATAAGGGIHSSSKGTPYPALLLPDSARSRARNPFAGREANEAASSAQLHADAATLAAAGDGGATTPAPTTLTPLVGPAALTSYESSNAPPLNGVSGGGGVGGNEAGPSLTNAALTDTAAAGSAATSSLLSAAATAVTATTISTATGTEASSGATGNSNNVKGSGSTDGARDKDRAPVSPHNRDTMGLASQPQPRPQKLQRQHSDTSASSPLLPHPPPSPSPSLTPTRASVERPAPAEAAGEPSEAAAAPHRSDNVDDGLSATVGDTVVHRVSSGGPRSSVTSASTAAAAAAATAATSGAAVEGPIEDEGDDEGVSGGEEAARSSAVVATRGTAKAALRDFDGVTPTPFSLFGAQEPFKPTPTPLHFLHPQLLPATELVAPQRQSGHAASAFVWPRFQAQLIVLCFTVYHYFYVVILEYSFALVRCEEATISVFNAGSTTVVEAETSSSSSTSSGSSTSANVMSYKTLVADRRVNCHGESYHAYRVAGITLGTLTGAVLPLGLLWLSYCGRRQRLLPGENSLGTSSGSNGGGGGGGIRYLRECCLAVLGLSEPYLWWEAVTLLCKWALVLFRHLIGLKNVAGLVICWTTLGYCTFLVYFQPFYGVFAQSLQVVVYITLTITAALQLLPLLDAASVDNGVVSVSTTPNAAQNAGGVLVVALPCLALAALLFITWATTLSRQRWPRLGRVLFALGGGIEVHNILHFLHRRQHAEAAAVEVAAGAATAATTTANATAAGGAHAGGNASSTGLSGTVHTRSHYHHHPHGGGGTGPTTTTTAAGAATATAAEIDNSTALRFSFAGYNMSLAQQARRKDDEEADDIDAEDLTLADQIVQAVRGRAALKSRRRRNGHPSTHGGGFSLWANCGVVGGLIGMTNHVHLLSRFIHENEGAVTGEAVLTTSSPTSASGFPITTTTTTAMNNTSLALAFAGGTATHNTAAGAGGGGGAVSGGGLKAFDKENSARVEAGQESSLQPLTVMNQEAGEEVLTMCEHLRQLEHFVLQMEKALERRTEN